ncbi:TPA: lipopolysaccharide biosynthesis protein [Vibrio parahaemolyticus]
MIEQKFRKFRNSLTDEQFEDPVYLEGQARIIAISDAALSNRILEKAKSLQQQKVNKINAVIRRNNRVLENKSLENPSQENVEVEESSSDEQKKPQNESSSITEIQKDDVTPTAESEEKPSVEEQPEHVKTGSSGLLVKHPLLKKQLPVLVIISFIFLFAFYQVFAASPRFESRAQLIVEQPDAMATMDTSMALLTGLGVQTATSDNQLLKAYILSNDMLAYLESQLALREHYTSSGIDVFSRLPENASLEEFADYYKKHIKVDIDEKSSVITILAQGFDINFSQQLVEAIVERAEWYINSISHQLAESQLEFIRNEHHLVEKRLEKSQINLLNFQQKYNLPDPTAEGVAMQQIAYSLEGEISKKEAELKTLRKIMSDESSQVQGLKIHLKALYEQLNNERSKLSNENGNNIAVSELLAKFTDYKVKMELALQAYTSSQISLEKARIEAYKQIKYLIVVEAPTKPEESTYPRAVYNILLFSVVIIGLSLILKIIVSVIRELR